MAKAKQGDAEANETAIDSFNFVIKAEAKLADWMELTASSHALYKGADEALRARIYPRGDASQLADVYRQPAELLTVLRVHSMFDRQEEVSFQSVKRRLEKTDVQRLVVDRFVGQRDTSREPLERACRSYIEGFLTAYGKIDFSLQGRVQHFRNIGLAHITLKEVEKTITHKELADLIQLAGDLQTWLTLAIRNRHASRLIDRDMVADQLTKEWTACMRRDLSAAK